VTWPAHHDGSLVRRVTDAVWSPGLERNIGYVWVPIDLASPGTRLMVESEHGDMAGTTAEIPFVDPRKGGRPGRSSARRGSPRPSGGRRPDGDGRQPARTASNAYEARSPTAWAIPGPATRPTTAPMPQVRFTIPIAIVRAARGRRRRRSRIADRVEDRLHRPGGDHHGDDERRAQREREQPAQHRQHRAGGRGKRDPAGQVAEPAGGEDRDRAEHRTHRVRRPDSRSLDADGRGGATST
jgi:hypothetical protein